MKIQFCAYCGTKLDDAARFCKNCGEPVAQAQQPVDEISSSDEPKMKIEPPKKEQTEEDTRSKRKIVYDGELYKCPNCGELLKSFTTVCPTCAYEIRGVHPNSPVEALSKKVEMASSLDDKIELIINFYIPNTKEDIYDFFILAVSNLEDKRFETDDAWLAKLEQAYHKAKLSFGNTAEFEYLEKLYIQTRKKVNKRERGIAAIFRRNHIAIVTALSICGGIIMIAIGIILYIISGKDGNSGAGMGGYILVMLGMASLIAPYLILEEMKEKASKDEKKRASQETNSNIRSIGKCSDEFCDENYDDMVEFLRSRGFRSVVAKPEKKRLRDTEGAVKSISIAGNTEFSEDDEFDIDSTIIIRYYSKMR